MERLKNLFIDFQDVINTPFITDNVRVFLENILSVNGIAYEINPYYLLVRPQKLDESKKNLLIMAHTDHPGIIFKNSREGQLMGLIGTSKISSFVKAQDVEIKIYTRAGDYLGQTRLLEVNNSPKQEIKINANFYVPANSVGYFDISRFSEDKDHYYAYNADDGIGVVLMLDSILKKQDSSNFNVFYVFMLHEEVHQLSSWDFASQNPINLTPQDYILNLECLKVESIDSRLPKNISPNYQSGPIIQLSNTGCLFGYKNEGTNELELVLKNLAIKNELQVQIGFIKDSCDCRSFTLQGISPSICSINIPNKYKHNGLDDGELRHESILKRDVETTFKLLDLLITSQNTQEATQGDSLSLIAKEKDLITDQKLMKNKEILNKRLAVAYKDKVERGYFYAEDLQDSFNDFILKIVSYIYYLSLKIS